MLAMLPPRAPQEREWHSVEEREDGGVVSERAKSRRRMCIR